MSNYLADLVARSFAPAEAIQPRLPSRFEPIADGASADTIAATDVTVMERAEENERATAYRGLQAMPDARAGSPASPQREPNSEPEAIAQSQPWREQRVPLSDAEITPARATRAPDDRRSEAAAARDEQLASSPTRAPVHVTVARRDRAPASNQHEASARPEPRQVVSPQPGSIQPDIAAAAEPSESQDRHGSQAAPQRELIQVTIGRVEVRAVAPPAAPAKAAAPQAHTLSLAEYLRGATRGRAGGGR